MGQYFKPVCVETLEWVYSHDYGGNGLKLMEHSYVGNDFVGIVMRLLSKGGKWYKKPIVWCGDYYGDREEENEKNTEYGLPSGNVNETGYYDLAVDEKKINPEDPMNEREQKECFIVNHTKKEYVTMGTPDTDELKAKRLLEAIEDDDIEKRWVIHPLPLLTALGNGRGGGDYHGFNEEMVGIWAGDILSVETEKPIDYKEIINVDLNNPFIEGYGN